MVLLHHEVVVDFPDGQPTENHSATLLEFGRTKSGKTISAMALTVGIPAGIGALVFFSPLSFYIMVWANALTWYMFFLLLQLLLQNKIKTRGVVRPIEPEVYMPGIVICFLGSGFSVTINADILH